MSMHGSNGGPECFQLVRATWRNLNQDSGDLGLLIADLSHLAQLAGGQQAYSAPATLMRWEFSWEPAPLQCRFKPWLRW
jgi:hypothetical protein